MTSPSELLGSRELLVNLTLRELRGKYKRSVLGWTWSLLNPLATMAIFTVVFAYFLDVQAPKGDPSGLHVFALYLLCGLHPCNFLSNWNSGTMGSLLVNSYQIKKVNDPRDNHVEANYPSWVVSFLIELAVLAVVLLGFGNFVVPWLVPVLALVAIQTTFVVGLGLMFSVLNVYFRDVQHLVGILLQLWFYATPIVYPITYVPEKVRFVYGLNPMVRFVEAYRDCLYDLRMPPLLDWAFLVVVSAVTLAVGWAIFVKLEPKLAEEM